LQAIRFASLGRKYFADMGCIPIGMRPVFLYLFYRAGIPNGIQYPANLLPSFGGVGGGLKSWFRQINKSTNKQINIRKKVYLCIFKSKIESV